MAPNVGRSLLRREDPQLLRGQASFIADLGEADLGIDRGSSDGAGLGEGASTGSDGIGHVVFVRSPSAHAVLGPIDAAEALAMPGVVAVVTAADLADIVIPKANPAYPDGVAQPLLATDRVRYVGQPVAALVAASVEEAVDAAELIVVDYDVLPAVTDPAVAVGDTIIVFDHLGTNTVFSSADTHPDEPLPDTDTSTDSAAVTVSRRIVSPRQSPAPIEPRGAIALWRGEDLHVWSSTQRPHGLRDQIGRVHGLERGAVHVIAGPNVGGGFGGKGAITVEELLLPRLARLVERPVRWIETRTEYQTSAPQSRGEVVDVALSGTTDGRFEAIQVHIVKDAGAYPMVGASLPAYYSRPITTGPYDIADARFSFTSVVTNAPSTSAFRGAGRGPIIHGIECAVDAFAATIGMDPAEVRRRNLVRPEQMPFDTPMGSTYDEADYPGDLDRALELVDYEQLRRDQEQQRDGSGSLLGIGIAAYNHISNGAGGEEASITIRPDGSALVITGSTDQGHGHDMAWAQIASDVLAIPIDQIEVAEGNTDQIATGVGAVGSRSLQTAGVAVHRSAEELVERARRLAADHFEAAVGDVVLDQASGQFTVVGTPAVTIDWSALATIGVELGDPDQELACGEVFAGPNTYPSGCHIAVVEVDPDTGFVTVIRYVGVDDAGHRVNPMIVEGQLHGGVAAGLGQALGETVAFDESGNPITSNFMDYAIPTIDLVPNIETAASEVHSSFNPMGFKGVGESGTIAAAPAVHLAVLDAIRHLVVDHLDMPCTPLRIWQALQ